MAKNKGIRRYQAGEISNLSFNNLGFDIAVRPYAGVPVYTNYTPPAGHVFISILSINGVGRIQARSVSGTPGDNLSKNGNYTNAPTDTSNMIMMLSADVIFGRFDEITIWRDEVDTADAYYKFILGTK